jgi:hypothetical protein
MLSTFQGASLERCDDSASATWRVLQFVLEVGARRKCEDRLRDVGGPHSMHIYRLVFFVQFGTSFFHRYSRKILKKTNIFGPTPLFLFFNTNYMHIKTILITTVGIAMFSLNTLYPGGIRTCSKGVWHVHGATPQVLSFL